MGSLERGHWDGHGSAAPQPTAPKVGGNVDAMLDSMAAAAAAAAAADMLSSNDSPPPPPAPPKCDCIDCSRDCGKHVQAAHGTCEHPSRCACKACKACLPSNQIFERDAPTLCSSAHANLASTTAVVFATSDPSEPSDQHVHHLAAVPPPPAPARIEMLGSHRHGDAANSATLHVSTVGLTFLLAACLGGGWLIAQRLSRRRAKGRYVTALAAASKVQMAAKKGEAAGGKGSVPAMSEPACASRNKHSSTATLTPAEMVEASEEQHEHLGLVGTTAPKKGNPHGRRMREQLEEMESAPSSTSWTSSLARHPLDPSPQEFTVMNLLPVALVRLSRSGSSLRVAHEINKARATVRERYMTVLPLPGEDCNGDDDDAATIACTELLEHPNRDP